MSNFWNRLVTKNIGGRSVIRPRLPARFEPVSPPPAEAPGGEVAVEPPPQPTPAAKHPAPRPRPELLSRQESARPAGQVANEAAPAAPDSPAEPGQPPSRRLIRFNTITPEPEHGPPPAPVQIRTDGESSLPAPQPPPVIANPARPAPPDLEPPARPPSTRPAQQPAPPTKAARPAPVIEHSAPAVRVHQQPTLEEAPRSTRPAVAAAELHPEPLAPASITPNIEPLARPRPAETPPTIRVKIGRIEVKAAAPQPSPPPRPARQRFQPDLPLDAYLKQRNGEER